MIDLKSLLNIPYRRKKSFKSIDSKLKSCPMKNIHVTLPSLVFERKVKSLPFQFPERSSTWVSYYGFAHKYYGLPGTNGLAYSSEEDESYL